MAQPHKGIEAATKYLKTQFAYKEDFDARDIVGETFSWNEVKDGLLSIKKTDPSLYRLLEYRWRSNRSRNDIANGLYLDPSTLKRKWDKAIHMLWIYLVHRDLCSELDSVDILALD